MTEDQEAAMITFEQFRAAYNALETAWCDVVADDDEPPTAWYVFRENLLPKVDSISEPLRGWLLDLASIREDYDEQSEQAEQKGEASE